MEEKINKNPGRIIEATSVKGDYVERADEFWSAESLRKRPINEQYPKLEGETDDYYDDRLQEIQTLTELAQADLNEEDKHEIEDGAYTEKSGKAATPNYKKFGVSALRTFDMTEKNPALFHSDEGKYGLERQQAQEKKAEYYIKLYQKNQPELSEFAGLVPDNELIRDQAALQKKENKIGDQNVWKSSEDQTKDERMSTWDRVAEAVLYPLVLNFGLFDDPSGRYRARAIYPSKYDDQFHGVDAAFMIPVGANERGEIRYAPITFDCYAGNSIIKVMDKFDKVSDDGRTFIKYAKTEDDSLITNVHPLNFIIGVDHATLIGDRGLMKGDNITHAPRAFMHDIYVQIYTQARLRVNYYQMLRCERTESEDVKLADVLSKEEFSDARQVIAVRDFFERKCEKTVINKKSSFALSYDYDRYSPVYLVYEEAQSLLREQIKSIKNIQKQKGWK